MVKGRRDTEFSGEFLDVFLFGLILTTFTKFLFDDEDEFIKEFGSSRHTFTA